MTVNTEIQEKKTCEDDYKNGYTVYVHKNITNGKVYVGITHSAVNRRWQYGWGYASQPLFYNAIKKYGWEGFEHEIIAEELTKEEACAMEKELIDRYRSNDREFGYNRECGGVARGKVSEETKQILREKNLGKKMSAESREKMSVAAKKRPPNLVALAKGREVNRGKKMSDEQRAAISERMKGNQIWLGRTLPPETREKIRQKAIGRQFSDEWRARLSESHKGLMKGEKHPMSRKVICVETGEVFPSITAAGESVGITHSRIRECCLGNRHTTKGYHWKFYEDYVKENLG